MWSMVWGVTTLTLILGGLIVVDGCTQEPPGDEASPEVIPLPGPRLSGPFSLEEVVLNRRSVRAFRPD